MYNAFGSCWSVPCLGLCWFLYLFLVYKKDLWIIKGGLSIYCILLFVMWKFLFLLFLFNGIQAGIQVIYLFCFSLGLQCYFQLANENYHWWWSSFTNSGCTGIVVFLFALYFYSKISVHAYSCSLLFV